MKVLLDTNIIIYREARKVVRDDIGLLFKWLDMLNYKKYIHPLTKDEICRYKDPQDVSSLMIKLASYNELAQTRIHPLIEKHISEFDVQGNDKNDTLLLNEVVQKSVDILISEDKKIHRNAALFNVSEKVFTIEDFLDKVNVENPSLIEYEILSIKSPHFGMLDRDDTFWGDFKQDYVGFEDWMNEKSQDPCYVSQDENGKILAFLYLKVEERNENYYGINPLFQPKRRLKADAFKVIDTGLKLGERFLRIIFENALKQNVEEIYLTTFRKEPQHESLVALIEQWGFKYHGVKNSESGEEEVYVRDFSKQFDEANIKHTYPFISQSKRVFLVPIWPKYHTDLLPDSILSNETVENFITDKVCRNAIHKVYTCRSVERSMKTGDIILFYRTRGLGPAYYTSVITTIGIVESVKTNIKDVETFISLCRKRSIFTDDELKETWNYKQYTRPFIVNFLYVYSFSKPYINRKQLIDIGVIDLTKGALQGFREISLEKFNLLLRECHVNRNFIVD